LAGKKGSTVHENKTSSTKGFTNLLTVEIETPSEKRKVSGTLLNGLGARIVKVDDYRVDVTPDGHIVAIHPHDQPDVIDLIGILLAEHDVTIATMQVDRLDAGGKAIMLLKVDKHVDQKALERLEGMEEIYEVTAVDL